MKRTSFQHQRWYEIDASPAQFGGLVEALNALHASNEVQQWWYGRYGIERPFHVYGLSLTETAPVVTVRFPGGGKIGPEYRHPGYAWIDAIAQPHGKTKLVMTYNFSTPILNLEARLFLWQLLFDWLAESGCPVLEEEEAAPAAVITSGEGTAESAKVTRPGPRREIEDKLKAWKGWLAVKGRQSQRVYCEQLDPPITPRTLRNWRDDLKREKIIP